MRSPTSAEKALKQILEALGYVVVPFTDRSPCDSANTVYSEMPLHNFRVDFALPQAQICLEADGERWHRQGLRRVKDRNRDAILRTAGWKILRFQSTLLEKYPSVAENQVRRGIDLLRFSNPPVL